MSASGFASRVLDNGLDVVPAVRSQLRRVAWVREPERQPTGGLQLDETKYEARLIECVYTDHRVVTDRTVDTHVKNLRRKLKAQNPESDPIRSIYGVGYKLEFGEEA